MTTSLDSIVRRINRERIRADVLAHRAESLPNKSARVAHRDAIRLARRVDRRAKDAVRNSFAGV